MVTVFLFHGTQGHSEENWFPWLRAELEKRGALVVAPNFPTPERQSLRQWTLAFEPYRRYWEGDSILVGHSIGATFLLRLLEIADTPLKASFLCAPVKDILGNKEFDDLNRTFIERPFDWRKIKKMCEAFYVFYAEDDPYIPDMQAYSMAQELETKVTLIPEGGHLNLAAGFSEFHPLLERIKPYL